MKYFACFVLALTACASTPRKPSSIGIRASVEGTWTGVGIYTDRKTMADLSLSCMNLSATAIDAKQPCENDAGTGESYHVQISCADPLLSDAGKNLFRQDFAVCEVISDLSHSPGANGRIVFSTRLTELNFSNSVFDVDQADAAAAMAIPLPGVEKSIRLLSLRFSHEKGNSSAVESRLFKPVP